MFRIRLRRRPFSRGESLPVNRLLVLGTIAAMFVGASVSALGMPRPLDGGALHAGETPVQEEESQESTVQEEGEETEDQGEGDQEVEDREGAEAAQQAEAPGSAFDAFRSRMPEADSHDVESIDAIVSAVYESISGPSDQPRDWDRFRSLFIPGARMIPTGPDPRQTGQVRIAVWSVDHYIEQANPFFREMGFYERELARRTERYGNMAHVFSTYESRVNPESPEPFQRGINSFQLVHDGERWWIVTIFWRGESEEEPLPQRYLTTPSRDTVGEEDDAEEGASPEAGEDGDEHDEGGGR